MSPTAARLTCVHLRVYLALLPSGPDAVRRLKLHRVRAAVRLTHAGQRASPAKMSVAYGVHGRPTFITLVEADLQVGLQSASNRLSSDS